MTDTTDNPMQQIKATNGWLLFEGRHATICECVEAAAQARANLLNANLLNANLRTAKLRNANLSYANLRGADLLNANLRTANLRYANLSGANLSNADLRYADLSGADLSGANLSAADLSGVTQGGADLSSANLSGAVYRGTKLGSAGLLKTASRSDGYTFLLFDCDDHTPRISAGCRWFTLPEACAHWQATRAGTPLGDETMDILDLFERHAARAVKEPAQ